MIAGAFVFLSHSCIFFKFLAYNRDCILLYILKGAPPYYSYLIENILKSCFKFFESYNHICTCNMEEKILYCNCK